MGRTTDGSSAKSGRFATVGLWCHLVSTGNMPVLRISASSASDQTPLPRPPARIDLNSIAFARSIPRLLAALIFFASGVPFLGSRRVLRPVLGDAGGGSGAPLFAVDSVSLFAVPGFSPDLGFGCGSSSIDDSADLFGDFSGGPCGCILAAAAATSGSPLRFVRGPLEGSAAGDAGASELLGFAGGSAVLVGAPGCFGPPGDGCRFFWSKPAAPSVAPDLRRLRMKPMTAAASLTPASVC